MRRYNLPLNDNYDLIDSYYTGSIEEGGGTACANCGRMITNVAEIKTSKGEILCVGMDCAETLTNLKGLHNASVEFAEMKAIRAKINKVKIPIENYINKNGVFCIYASGVFNIQKEIEFIKKYLPSHYSNLSNPEKIGYIPFSIPKNPLPFNKCRPQEILNNSYTLYIETFKVIIDSFIEDSPNKNCFFKIAVYTGDTLISTDRFYMYSDILNRTENIINTYLFNKYNNQLPLSPTN